MSGQRFITAKSGKWSLIFIKEYSDIGFMLMNVKMKEMSSAEAMVIIKSGRQKAPLMAVIVFVMQGYRKKAKESQSTNR